MSSSSYVRRAVLPMPISTISCMATQLPLTGVVVRRFDGHRDVVRMALFQTRRRDLNELRLLQLLDGRRTGVAHGGTQAAGELMDHRRQRTAERHPALDALRRQLVLGERIVLEVAVLRIGFGAGPAL